MADLGIIAAAAAESRAKKVAREVALEETQRLYAEHPPSPGEKGQDGSAGKDGKSVLVGHGPPPETSDDTYLDTITGDLWRAGEVIGNLQGPAGIAAKAALDGADGTDGTSIFAGSGVPKADGDEGDLYIETQSGDLYRFNSRKWHVIGNLQGPPGPPGRSGGRVAGGGGGASLADGLPLVESGAGSAGTATTASRSDHVHPAGAGASAGSYLSVVKWGVR